MFSAFFVINIIVCNVPDTWDEIKGNIFFLVLYLSYENKAILTLLVHLSGHWSAWGASQYSNPVSHLF